MPLAHFDGALAVITGAGSGIGRATALALAENGATVVAADSDLASAERTVALAEALGAKGAAHRVDVADGAAMEAFAAEVKDAHRTPDIVVNSAEVVMVGPFLKHSAEDWERVIGVNLWGVIHGSRLFGAQMRARVAALPAKPEKPNFGGHIVNVASASAFAPSSARPAYCTTKAAVLMLSECLRAELASSRIGVTAVCPGFVTAGIARRAVPPGADEEARARFVARAERLLRLRDHPPERVADQIVRAIIRNRPVVAVNAEGKALRAVSRTAPPLLRLLARHSPAPQS
ncbi:SDR family NAD(P)-dependent oxidoreductase [Actinomadura kijaniata]|uniref:SDR family NAD(P)-dependent oxidoreductase n=1 Tax=Actinomadura kijaniata TaxID=46161 RepID=UPI000831F389|nr:SDR family NAD(P)-dependent oxidoreductase [Actinomadura kijaniata]